MTIGIGECFARGCVVYEVDDDDVGIREMEIRGIC